MSSVFSIMKSLIIIGISLKLVYSASTTLQLVNAVFRHGDRTPTGTYPNDPYGIETFDPPGLGILTERGKLRATDLGKFLRKEYNEFLGKDYVPGTVYAQSTHVNRTQETLQHAMKGIYPEASIPTVVQTPFRDIVLQPQMCIGYQIAYSLALNQKDVLKEMSDMEGLRKNLTDWTGMSMDTPHDLYHLYSTLEAESHMNLTLPSWTKGIFPDGDLIKGYILQAKVENYNDNMKRKSGGFLIEKFIKDMKGVQSGQKKWKLMLYGGHETTVLAVLYALGVYFPHVPKYTSAVITELHLIDKLYYVKVKYYKGIPAETMDMTIPGCKTLCPLDQFASLLKNVMPSELDLLCATARQGLSYIYNEYKHLFKNVK